MKNIYWILFWTIVATDPFLRLKLNSDDSQASLYVQGYLGNPPQKLTLTVDTGSDRLVTNCANCQTKVQLQPQRQQYIFTDGLCIFVVRQNQKIFDCRKCVDDKCFVISVYGPYSTIIQGDSYQDEFSFIEGDDQQFPVNFICSSETKVSQYIAFKQNGIIGLGPDQNTNPIYSYFNTRKQNISHQFTMCLGDVDGYLQIGLDPFYNTQQQNITLFYSQNMSSYYIVSNITSIQLGESVFNINPEDKHIAMFDSGSSYNYFPPKIYLKLYQQIQSICSSNHKICLLQKLKNRKVIVQIIESFINIKQSYQRINQLFPNMILTIQGKILTIKPQEYLFLEELSQLTAIFSLRFAEKDNNNTYVFGNHYMKHKRSTFNIVDGTVTFFSNMDCTYVPQHLDYITHVRKSTIFISYTILIVLFLFILFGQKIVLTISKWRNRKNTNQLVEESLQSSSINVQ